MRESAGVDSSISFFGKADGAETPQTILRAHSGYHHRGIFYEGNSCAKKQTQHKPIIGEAGLPESSEEMRAQLADSRTHVGRKLSHYLTLHSKHRQVPRRGRHSMLIPTSLRFPARTFYCSQSFPQCTMLPLSVCSPPSVQSCVFVSFFFFFQISFLPPRTVLRLSIYQFVLWETLPRNRL